MKTKTTQKIRENPANARRLPLFVFCVSAFLLFRVFPSPAPPQPAPAPPELSQLIQARDRVLFVGDDLTQQMFYTRGLAAALLPLMPEADLRFFNGGRNDATAATAAGWIDELLTLAKPTVVMVCFGMNDGGNAAVSPELESAYRDSLDALVTKIAGHAGVRQVVVIGPPSIQVGLSDRLDAVQYDKTLLALSKTALAVARQHKAHFIDLSVYTAAVYAESNRVGGEPLTIDGRWPTEAGGLVIASLILRGLGVNDDQFAALGWSPMVPRRMQQIRQVLAFKVKPPTLEKAQQSRDLYEQLRRPDEAFFRLWRLSDRNALSPSRDVMWATFDQEWAKVREIVKAYEK